MSTFNNRTLQKRISLIQELISSAEATNQDIICIREHRILHNDISIKEYMHENWKLITSSAWNNSINATIGGVGIILNSHPYKVLIKFKRNHRK